MTYNPRLPEYIQPISSISNSGNKLSASSINSLSRANKLSVAADGETLPICYGTDQLPAKIFAVGTVGSSLLLGVAWCHGEIEGVLQVLLDGAPPVGVTVTNYTGSQTQVADPTLSANISGYNDALLGVAYSVLVIPTTYERIPKITGVIQGLKVYDPRNMTTTWSDNSLLCLNDFVTNNVYGLGLDTLNVEECANFNDDIMPDGGTRCRVGVSFTSPVKSWNLMYVLAEYAEVFIAVEGVNIKFIPDRKTTPVVEYSAKDIIKDSLQMSVGDTSSIANTLEVRYKQRLTNDEIWGVVSKKITTSDVDTGSVPEILSSVSLEGIYREVEAQRKATSRLRRPQISGNITWQSFDLSVRNQVGDVVRINIPEIQLLVDVRITSVGLVNAGRYSFTAVRYSDFAYSDEEVTSPVTGTIPVGAIALQSGSTLPLGWELYDTLLGKYIKGVGQSTSGIGGSATYNIVATSSLSGAHSGNKGLTIKGGNDDIVSGWTNPTTEGDIEDVHDHTIDVLITPNVKTQSYQLIRATQEHTTLQDGVTLLSGAFINDTDYKQVTTLTDGLLKSGSGKSSEGSYASSEYHQTDALQNHLHAPTLEGKVLGGSLNDVKFRYTASGGHFHNANINIVTNPIRCNVLAYTSVSNPPIRQGIIIALPEGTPPPTGWSKCDGNLGTPDLRDAFVEVSNNTVAGTRKGDNTLSWSSSTMPAGAHDHLDDFLGTSFDIYDSIETLHGNIVAGHSHSLSGSGSWQPEWVALEFYQFTGAEI